MITRKKKICKRCQTPQYLFARGMCQPCSREDAAQDTDSFRTYTTQGILIEGTTKPLRRTKIKTQRKTTGEKELFIEIWAEREHVCTNCKEHLGDEPLAHYFAHILAKGKHPDLRLVKTNIMLLCFDCHYAYDHQTKEHYARRKR